MALFLCLIIRFVGLVARWRIFVLKKNINVVAKVFDLMLKFENLVALIGTYFFDLSSTQKL